MDFRRELDRMFRYDEWANREVLRTMEAIAAPPARSLKLLAHIVAAERLWLARIERVPQPLPVWPEFDLAACRAQLEVAAREWRAFLETADDARLDAAIDYVNSKGERYTSRAADILSHVLMHGTYHRGQIAADVRGSGHQPPYTDFIHAVRQGNV